MGRVRRRAVQKRMGDFFKTFVAQEQAAQDQQRRYHPGSHQRQGQGRRHQDELVAEGALGHGPHHRQFTLGAHAGDFFSIDRQVVAQHPCGFPGGHLGHGGHVVEDRGNIVQQYQQAATGHGIYLLSFPAGNGLLAVHRPTARLASPLG